MTTFQSEEDHGTLHRVAIAHLARARRHRRLSVRPHRSGAPWHSGWWILTMFVPGAETSPRCGCSPFLALALFVRSIV
ncbi:hypothetical protein BCPG_05013 [Burkholderia cenocepacia PC184]|nr:hypothetical protein BCPG_05013 [Burkholderia cenocepacia PC184]